MRLFFFPKAPVKYVMLILSEFVASSAKSAESVTTISQLQRAASNFHIENKQKKTENLFLTTLASRTLMIYGHLPIDKRH